MYRREPIVLIMRLVGCMAYRLSNGKHGNAGAERARSIEDTVAALEARLRREGKLP